MREVGSALFALFLLLVTGGPALAAPPATEREVEHLLRLMENSSCAFLRNDSRYSGRLAAAYFRGKFQDARARITSTEAFIGEMLSRKGERYAVDCASGQPENGESWLKGLLAGHRRTEMARQ